MGMAAATVFKNAAKITFATAFAANAYKSAGHLLSVATVYNAFVNACVKIDVLMGHKTVCIAVLLKPVRTAADLSAVTMLSVNLLILCSGCSK
jgi:hypothetical protein